MAVSRYRERYWIWGVYSQKDDTLLMAGLGYRKDAVKAWHDLTDVERNIPIRTFQLLHRCKIKPSFVKYAKHSSHERRVDARAALLNLRMQHPFAVIEDWYDRLE